MKMTPNTRKYIMIDKYLSRQSSFNPNIDTNKNYIDKRKSIKLEAGHKADATKFCLTIDKKPKFITVIKQQRRETLIHKSNRFVI